MKIPAPPASTMTLPITRVPLAASRYTFSALLWTNWFPRMSVVTRSRANVNALVAAVSDRIALDSNAGGGIGEIDAVLFIVENLIADDRVSLTTLDPHADLGSS